MNTNVHSEDYKYIKALLESLGDSGQTVKVYDRPLDEEYQNTRGIVMSVTPLAIRSGEKRNVQDYEEMVDYNVDLRVNDKQYATYLFVLSFIERIKSELYKSDLMSKIDEVEAARDDRDEAEGIWYKLTFTITTKSVRYPCG